MTLRLRWLLLVVCLAGVAVLAAACQTGPVAEAKPVKVGLLNSLTGVFAPNGDDINKGFKLYLELHGNKLGNHPVELIVDDDESAAAAGLTKLRKLVEQDKVDVTAGIVSSAVMAAVRDYIHQQGTPFVIDTANSNIFTQHSRSPSIFRPMIGANQSSYPLGKWVCDNTQHRKIVLIAQDYLYGWESSGPFARLFSECGAIVQELYPPLTTTDFGPFLLQIDKSADAVYASVVGAGAIPFIKQYRSFGVNKPLIAGGGMTIETFLREAGKEAEGVITVTPYSAALDTKLNKEFVEAYKKKYGVEPSLYSYNGWLPALVLDEALKKVDNPSDREALKKALREVKVETPTGSFSFDQYQQGMLDTYIAEVRKAGDGYQNAIKATYKQVNQFWTFKPDEELAKKPYAELKGTWTKK